MKGIWLLLIGLCLIVSGCVSQNQGGATGGNDQQNSISSQDASPGQGGTANGATPPAGPSGQPGQRGFGGFSQAAADACAGKAENDTCEFTLNGTTINGNCGSRRTGQLTCLPARMNQRPPQEMVDACTGKSANDSCEFTLNGTVVNGNCRGRASGELTCFSSEMFEGMGNRSFDPRRGQQQNPGNPAGAGAPNGNTDLGGN